MLGPTVRTCPYTKVDYVRIDGVIYADTGGVADNPVKNWVDRIGAPADDDSLAFYMNCMGDGYFDGTDFEDDANRVYNERFNRDDD